MYGHTKNIHAMQEIFKKRYSLPQNEFYTELEDNEQKF